jgi:ribose transport system substrate-binding protein
MASLQLWSALSRRRVLSGMGVLATAVSGMPLNRAFAQDTPKLFTCVPWEASRSPYNQAWLAGAQAFASAKGLELVSSEAPYGAGLLEAVNYAVMHGCNLLNLNVLYPDVLPEIVRTCQYAGAYLVTQWSKPDDLHPWGSYVAHISFNDVGIGANMAEMLFKAIGQQGRVVALGGGSGFSALERKRGFDAVVAGFPSIELLDFRDANGSRDEAAALVGAWLQQPIEGIWAANDDMALGALEALRAGYSGRVLITGIGGTPEAIAAIEEGEMLATVYWDPFWQGGMGLSIGYQAMIGGFIPQNEPDEHREFCARSYAITQESVSAYNALNAPGRAIDWDDLWTNVAGPIGMAPDMIGCSECTCSDCEGDGFCATNCCSSCTPLP